MSMIDDPKAGNIPYAMIAGALVALECDPPDAIKDYIARSVHDVAQAKVAIVAARCAKEFGRVTAVMMSLDRTNRMSGRSVA